ncbi:MAG: hypothetical protein ABIP02_02055, partial [Arenimonas sp.]
MELRQSDTIEVLDWAKLFPRHDRLAAPPRTQWERAILFIVIALHMSVLAYLFSRRANIPINADVPDAALQVTFIERILLPDTSKAATDRNVKNKSVSADRVPPSTNASSASSASKEILLEMDTEPLLDNALRLSLD